MCIHFLSFYPENARKKKSASLSRFRIFELQIFSGHFKRCTRQNEILPQTEKAWYHRKIKKKVCRGFFDKELECLLTSKSFLFLSAFLFLYLLANLWGNIRLCHCYEIPAFSRLVKCTPSKFKFCPSSSSYSPATDFFYLYKGSILLFPFSSNQQRIAENMRSYFYMCYIHVCMCNNMFQT